MIKPGDLIYFKTIKRTPSEKEKMIQFKNNSIGFGMMLGIKPANQPPPTEAVCMMLMGMAGYISFDDVVKFLGKENGQKCIEEFEKKYYPKKSPLILPEPGNGKLII
jgi:hypothetical protein